MLDPQTISARLQALAAEIRASDIEGEPFEHLDVADLITELEGMARLKPPSRELEWADPEAKWEWARQRNDHERKVA